MAIVFLGACLEVPALPAADVGDARGTVDAASDMHAVSDIAVALSADDEFVCALLTDRTTISCWGPKSVGMSFGAIDTWPGAVTPIRKIDVGAGHVCTLNEQNEVWCMGANEVEQRDPAGDETPPQWAFTRMHRLAANVGLGVRHTCVVTTGGDIECWGLNTSGQAQPSLPSMRFTDVCGGAAHTCAVTDTEDVYCWGDIDELIPGGLSTPTPTRIDITW